MVPACVSLHIVLFWTLGVWVACVQSFDPCSAYATISDAWRFPGQSDTSECDRYSSGWYKFEVDGQNAEIPTQCMQDYACGGKVSMHVDLEGKSLPAVGETVDASLCGSYNVLGVLDCCVLRQPVTIRRCFADVFIYRLTPMVTCPVVICAKKMGEDVPQEYLGKQGDTPLSGGADNVTNRPTAFPEICPEGLPRCADGYCGACTPPPATPRTSTPEAALSTAEEIVRTMVPFTTSLPDASFSTSTYIGTSSPTAPSVNSSATNFTEPEDISSPAFSSNDTLDNVTSANASLSNTTVSQNDTDAEAVFNVTSTTDDDWWDFKTDESTPQSNTTERPAVLTNSSEMDKQLGDLNSTTLTFASTVISMATSSPAIFPVSSVSTEAEGKSSSHLPHGGDPPQPTRVPGLSTVSPTAQVSNESTMAPDTSSSPAVQAVRFWLRKPFSEGIFVQQLEEFAANHSEMLAHTDSGVWHLGASLPEELPDNMTVYQDVVFSEVTSGGALSAWHVAEVLNKENFADQLFMVTNITLVMLCPATNSCVPPHIDSDDADSAVPEIHSLFERNQALFIAVIVVAALFLLAVLLVVCYLRNRRQGTWVLAADHDEKDPEHLSIESPMTDSQIMQGERGGGAGTPLTANGRDGSHTPDDIPAADEDNGWVVPIDQAPPHQGCASDGTATKTEDTQF